MIHKKFDEIEEEDIRRLIENEVTEGKDLEYKSALPLANRDQRTEFLFDLCAFANSTGGDLLIGVDTFRKGEKKGSPKGFSPVSTPPPDEMKQTITNLVRDRIEPRLRFDLREIQLQDGEGYLLLIHVPRSFESPHTVRNSSRFYVRTPTGKEPLDVHGIRELFVASSSFEERIRNWRNDRLAKIAADETPVRLAGNGRIVIHMVPIRGFLEGTAVELRTDDKQRAKDMQPVYARGSGPRFNLDGVLYTGNTYSEGSEGYCQLFRYGQIESVCADAVIPYEDTRIIGHPTAAREIVGAVSRHLKALRSLVDQGRVFVSIAFLGVLGAEMFTQTSRLLPHSRNPIDRENLVLPEIVIDTFDCDVAREVRPAIDALYNACGYEGCPDYDDEGNYRPRA